MSKVKTLFLDIGGVILTNGWDHTTREKAAKHFDIDFSELEQRHQPLYNQHEIDKVTLDEYLNHAVFWKRRDFTLQQFKEFMFEQSQPLSEMLLFIKEFLKNHPDITITAVSNEGRELAEYRLQKFDLSTFIHSFFISCFVHIQKPSPEIYRLVMDVVQVFPDQVVYIDDRPNLVEAAKKLGIPSIIHTSVQTTSQELLSLI